MFYLKFLFTTQWYLNIVTSGHLIALDFISDAHLIFNKFVLAYKIQKCKVFFEFLKSIESGD